MGLPKRFQDLFIGDDLGVELDLNNFRMPCLTGADLLVGGILGSSAGVAARNGFYTRKHLELRFRTPKAPAAQNCSLRRMLYVFHSLVLCHCCQYAAGQNGCGQECASDSFHVFMTISHIPLSRTKLQTLQTNFPTISGDCKRRVDWSEMSGVASRHPSRIAILPALV